jgi:hypothetical protein
MFVPGHRCADQASSDSAERLTASVLADGTSRSSQPGLQKRQVREVAATEATRVA